MPIDQPQQSFVPKKIISTQIKKTKVPAGLFFVISFVLFIAALGAAASVYFYEIYEEKEITNKKEYLEGSKEAFEPSFLLEVKQLDARINSAGDILNNHIALSNFFNFLEENTLKAIQFSEFNYTKNNDGEIEVSLLGSAKNYSSIALQSDVFGESKFILNPIFSDLSLNEKGEIDFRVEAKVDSQLVLYKEVIKEKGADTATTN